MKKKLISFILVLCIALSLVTGAAPEVHAAGGYSIRVNYSENVVTIYQNGNPIKAFLCSTGTWTPHSGTYKMSTKYRWGLLKGNVWGQYCTVITGNIWFHSVPYLKKDSTTLEYWEYDKLGTSCSAGCVRLCVRDVKWIYDNCPSGTPVTFYSSSDPGPLGKPTSPKISSAPDSLRGWDPTDPASSNPWNGSPLLTRYICTSNNYISAAFDAKYYADRYGDLKNAFGYNESLLMNHFLTYGVNEGRQASPNFSITQYKANYPELVAKLGNDNIAYINYYAETGRKNGDIANFPISGIDKVFDAEYYASRYTDLKKAYGYDYNKLRNHFLTYGIREGRQASASFSVSQYKSNYGDLRKAYGDNNMSYVIHYITYGVNENRVAGIQIANLERVFDPAYYANRYSDLKKAFGYDRTKLLNHFLKYGIKEGRQASAEFSVTKYKNRYSDLRKAYGDNNLSYVNHYLNYGIKEGRKGN